MARRGPHSLDLKGNQAPDADFFPVEDDLVLTQAPSIGTVKSVMGESIVPVVAAAEGENKLRCVGTGFFISCTGLLITAAHVVTDPVERKYSKAVELDDVTWLTEKLNFGAMIPTTPPQGKGYHFYPFEWSMLLAQRSESPLAFAGVDLKLTSDIAMGKIPARIDGSAHQPLTMIQPRISGTGMVVGSSASAVGYAGMVDVAIAPNERGQVIGDYRFDLHVSTGPVLERFPENVTKREVPTPGPCFSFAAMIPPGMSGAPIFDREGIYVHGVVSKGWEDATGMAKYSFGSMLAPSMGLPIARLGGASLIELQQASSDGIPIVRGGGLYWWLMLREGSELARGKKGAPCTAKNFRAYLRAADLLPVPAFRDIEQDLRSLDPGEAQPGARPIAISSAPARALRGMPSR